MLANNIDGFTFSINENQLILIYICWFCYNEFKGLTMKRIDAGFTINNNTVRQVSFDRTVLDNENNGQENDSFVTQLTAYHLTGRYQKQYVLNIMQKMEMTGSVREFESLKYQMREHLQKLQLELIERRNEFFITKNEGSPDVYGELANNIDPQYRDLYIKNLISYYELIKSLKEISDNIKFESGMSVAGGYQSFSDIQDAAIMFLDDSFSMESLRLPDSSSLYGDLSAVNNLMQDLSARVPDFTYNCGPIDVD